MGSGKIWDNGSPSCTCCLWWKITCICCSVTEVNKAIEEVYQHLEIQLKDKWHTFLFREGCICEFTNWIWQAAHMQSNIISIIKWKVNIHKLSVFLLHCFKSKRNYHVYRFIDSSHDREEMQVFNIGISAEFVGEALTDFVAKRNYSYRAYQPKCSLLKYVSNYGWIQKLCDCPYSKFMGAM